MGELNVWGLGVWWVGGLVGVRVWPGSTQVHVGQGQAMFDLGQFVFDFWRNPNHANIFSLPRTQCFSTWTNCGPHVCLTKPVSSDTSPRTASPRTALSLNRPSLGPPKISRFVFPSPAANFDLLLFSLGELSLNCGP